MGKKEKVPGQARPGQAQNSLKDWHLGRLGSGVRIRGTYLGSPWFTDRSKEELSGRGAWSLVLHADLC